MSNIVPDKQAGEKRVRVMLRPKACICAAFAMGLFLLTVGLVVNRMSGDTLSIGWSVASAASCVLFAGLALLFRIFERPRETTVKAVDGFVIHWRK